MHEPHSDDASLLHRAVLFGLSTWLAGISAAAAADPSALLATNDLANLHGALECMGMTEADLGFDKDVAKPRWALGWVRETLRQPLRLPETAARIRAAATGDTAEVWRLSSELLEASAPSPARDGREVGFAASNALTPHLAGFIGEFVEQAGLARDALDRALAPVPPAGRSYAAASVLAGLLALEDHADRAAAIRAAGATSGDVARVEAEALDLDPAPASSNVLDVLLGVDPGELLRGGERLHAAAVRLAEQARSVRDWPAAPVVVPTELGNVVVGTPGPDRYEAPALLIIDPGGDDVYAGEAGVANGLRAGPGRAESGAARPVEVAATIDLAGNDVYEGRGVFGPGSALFGLAIQLDAEGNDVRHDPYAGQAAALCGVAWLEDRAGDDSYRGGQFCQGAAVAGLAVLDDGGGNDLYEAGLAAQAYSGVRGAGWLIDRAGNDRYLAGNREPDWGRHADRFLSLSQGFSIGMRPFSGGGFAALVDLAGNDTYVADVYGQGVSYWYSAGFLLDLQGNDTYRMFHYGQGSGIHLSLGLLSDEGGDDAYVGSVLAQGNGHDYAVGMLIDRAGNDSYTADQHSQGRGLYNALGILVDAAGDDVYFARQTNECQGLGHEGATREYGCLGLLIDESGADQYACRADNATATLRPWYGLVWDGGSAGTNGTPARRGLRAFGHTAEAATLRHPAVAAPAPPAAKTPAHEIQDLDWAGLTVEQLLVLAQQPGNRAASQAIRSEAEQELRTRGATALEGLMRQAHLENLTIQLRTQEIVDALPIEESAPLLAGFLKDEHPRTRRLAAYYLGMHGRPVERTVQEPAAPASAGVDHALPQGSVDAILARLRPLLDDDEAAGAAIRTLGKWRDGVSRDRIEGFLKSEKEPRRAAAANALREIGDPLAVPALLAALRDPVFTVRMTAQRALIALGGPAERAALAAWPAASAAEKRRLLAVLAAGESRAARRVVKSAREDADPEVRADAALLDRAGD